MSVNTDIRRMCAADLPAVMAIQAQAYPPVMNEPEAVFAQRLQASPDYCWVAELDDGLAGYLFCYRSQHGKITALGAGFMPSETGDCLYLHDLAIARQARGTGVAGQLIKQALAAGQARKMRHAALVSVQGAQPFWEKHGFRPAAVDDPKQAENLASYPPPACYMSQLLVTA